MEINKIMNTGNIETLSLYNPVKDIWQASWYLHKDEDGNYYHYETYFQGIPSIEEVKKVIIDFYNRKCEEEILKGLHFEGNLVWLSSENQFNYKSAFDFAVQTEGKNLPVRFKFGTETDPIYRTFETINDLKEFITLIMSHINNTLNKYWTLKDDLDWNNYKK